jgi:cysteine sulfinate desulfinase/cysteine desulfurase-like protein
VGEPDVGGDRGVVEELVQLNNELATMARERARRERELERTRQRLQAALEELETSYWHLKKIQEFLPLCMGCGRIKTAEAEWQSVAEYLKDNEIFLSHGYCPPCSAAVLQEYGLDDEEPQ